MPDIYQLEPDDLLEPEEKEPEEVDDYDARYVPDEVVDKALDDWYDWFAK